ncbi:MAG: flippase-like domain-containing protein, partial [Bacteroidales bacterium]|nr:flippase-like domain-containing protein [Bacteroidales bacterium]
MKLREVKKWNWLLLLRLIGIALFIVILLRLDLPKVWNNLREINPLFFILAILFQLLMLLIKGIRWQMLKAENIRSGNFIYNLGAFLESYAIGVFTPGRLGEFTRAGYE